MYNILRIKKKIDGFRKVIDVQQGLANNATNDRFEFHHPLFKRGRQDLIEQIKRKVFYIIKILINQSFLQMIRNIK